jgi:hypothetical protein
MAVERGSTIRISPVGDWAREAARNGLVSDSIWLTPASFIIYTELDMARHYRSGTDIHRCARRRALQRRDLDIASRSCWTPFRKNNVRSNRGWRDWTGPGRTMQRLLQRTSGKNHRCLRPCPWEERCRAASNQVNEGEKSTKPPWRLSLF